MFVTAATISRVPIAHIRHWQDDNQTADQVAKTPKIAQLIRYRGALHLVWHRRHQSPSKHRSNQIDHSLTHSLTHSHTHTHTHTLSLSLSLSVVRRVMALVWRRDAMDSVEYQACDKQHEEGHPHHDDDSIAAPREHDVAASQRALVPDLQVS